MPTPTPTRSENDPPVLVPIEIDGDGSAEVEALGRMSRRGRLPGFQRGRDGELFSVAAHGKPFDKRLIATVQGGWICWTLTLERRLPAALAVGLVLGVWPGLPITDSLLVTYFPGSYGRWTSGWFATWMWYLPLSIASIPVVWRTAMRQTDASAAESAAEAVEKIRSELAGRSPAERG